MKISAEFILKPPLKVQLKTDLKVQVKIDYEKYIIKKFNKGLCFIVVRD